jgi:hypothetical protein
MNTNEVITKKYFDEKTKNFVTKDYLDKKLENFVTKDHLDRRLELMLIEIRQHMTDLNTAHNEKLKGVCDQVLSIDQKLTRLEDRVIGMDQKLSKIDANTFHIKGELKEKTNKKETLELKRRIIRLEAKSA